MAAFGLALDGPWLFDDHRLIAENPFVHDLGNWTRWFTHPFWDVSPGQAGQDSERHLWRPLVLASYALDWTLGGGSRVVFHATNLLLHGTAAALAYATLRRWLGVGWPAVVAALLWAIHPAKAESVAWISGRPDLLLTVGVLLALAGIAARLDRRRWGLSVELLGVGIAYGSKEHAIVLPALVLGELCAHAGWPPLGKLDRRSLAEILGPQLLVAIGYLVWRQLWLPLRVGGPEPGQLGERLGTVLETYGRYGAMVLWPGDLSFGGSLIHYADGGRVVHWGYLGGGVLIGFVCLGAVWRYRARSDLLLGVLLFPILLLPVCNAVAQVYTVLASPRFTYLPTFGIAFLVGLGLRRLAVVGRWGAAVAAVALVIASGARAVVRTLDFADERRFWTYEIERSPRFLPALEHFVVAELLAGRPRAALALVERGYLGAAGTAGASGAGTLLKQALEAWLQLTPDLDRSRLQSLLAFVVELRAGRDAEFRSDAGDPLFAVPAQSQLARELGKHEMFLVSLEARLRSRLGDDRRARELTATLAQRCPSCGEQRVLIPVAARIPDFPLAREMVQNLRSHLGVEATADVAEYLAAAEARRAALVSAPAGAKVALQAWYYAGVGAWARAHQVVLPLHEQAETLRFADAVKVAELAFRAGDAAAARRLLARWEDAATSAERFEHWARDMRWIDAARPEEQALPPVLTEMVTGGRGGEAPGAPLSASPRSAARGAASGSSPGTSASAPR